MAEDTTALAVRLRGFLAQSRNADGGWGYYAGKASRLEPTCWATLALVRPGQAVRDRNAAQAFFERLTGWQQESGLLAEAELPPNLAFNGLAAFVAAACGETDAHRALGMRLLSSIGAVYGVRLWPSIYQRQNNRLRGWPWVEGTFSWTEPTSWCLLALKHRRQALNDRERRRIGEAEALLLDRCCRVGGWNVGNSNVLGRELSPHVATTAPALLALQDRVHLPPVRRSVAYLQEAWPLELSGVGLALTALALTALGLPAGEIGAALSDVQRRSNFLSNLAVTGMAAVALDTLHGSQNFFSL